MFFKIQEVMREETGGLCRKSALRHSREQRKRERKETGGGRAGAQRGERGVCLH